MSKIDAQIQSYSEKMVSLVCEGWVKVMNPLKMDVVVFLLLWKNAIQTIFTM